jgi:hypothetical protein
MDVRQSPASRDAKTEVDGSMCFPLILHSCYMPCPSHPRWLDHSNLKKKDMTLLIILHEGFEVYHSGIWYSAMYAQIWASAQIFKRCYVTKIIIHSSRIELSALHEITPDFSPVLCSTNETDFRWNLGIQLPIYTVPKPVNRAEYNSVAR